MRIEEGVSLSRLTTLGTGGAARAFARPASVDELGKALRWARSEGLEVHVVGLGSNLLVADEGIDGLVVKLDGELAGVQVEGSRIVAGGGAANAVCLHRARDAGLGGFEFACAIPGTVGGGVKMNAGAWGGDFSQVLREALVIDADGASSRSGAELELAYRRSGLRSGQVVARAVLELAPRPAAEIRAKVKELNERRKASQPVNKRTFGSVFKNPEHELGAGQMLDACGLKGHRIGGALISPRHANFIENGGDATSADAVALMVEGRRRAFERFGVRLEHEVQLVGNLELTP